MRAPLGLALILCAATAHAQSAPPASPKPGLAPAFVPMNPAVEADRAAMQTMIAGMGKPYSGDADQDFISHMIPHQQAAIDMAEAELKYGADSRLKQMAARIIAARQHEIAFMQSWADKHPGAPSKIDPKIQYK